MRVISIDTIWWNHWDTQNFSNSSIRGQKDIANRAQFFVNVTAWMDLLIAWFYYSIQYLCTTFLKYLLQRLATSFNLSLLKSWRLSILPLNILNLKFLSVRIGPLQHSLFSFIKVFSKRLTFLRNISKLTQLYVIMTLSVPYDTSKLNYILLTKCQNKRKVWKNIYVWFLVWIFFYLNFFWMCMYEMLSILHRCVNMCASKTIHKQVSQSNTHNVNERAYMHIWVYIKRSEQI